VTLFQDKMLKRKFRRKRSCAIGKPRVQCGPGVNSLFSPVPSGKSRALHQIRPRPSKYTTNPVFLCCREPTGSVQPGQRHKPDLALQADNTRLPAGGTVLHHQGLAGCAQDGTGHARVHATAGEQHRYDVYCRQTFIFISLRICLPPRSSFWPLFSFIFYFLLFLLSLCILLYFMSLLPLLVCSFLYVTQDRNSLAVC